MRSHRSTPCRRRTPAHRRLGQPALCAGLFWLSAALSCAVTARDAQAAPTSQSARTPPNIVYILADDYGVDASPLYHSGDAIAPTPTLERMAERGVVFEQSWTSATCSPTRANLISGLHGFRTGVLGPLPWAGNSFLPPVSPGSLDVTQADLLPKRLGSAGYDTALIGKWHITSGSDYAARAEDPVSAGYDYFNGTLDGFPTTGFADPPLNLRPVTSYFRWRKVVDDKPGIGNATRRVSDVYATTDQVDAALAWVRSRGERPFYLNLSLSAPHAPFQLPPLELVDTSIVRDVIGIAGRYVAGSTLPSHPRLVYNAMISAMDRELGRLLDGFDRAVLADTIVVFQGDNGTPLATTVAPFDPQKSKGTHYEGGIHTPLVVMGPGVKRHRRSRALVHAVDVYATLLDLAGVARPAGIDGRSFRKELRRPSRHAGRVRRTNYAELDLDVSPATGDICGTDLGPTIGRLPIAARGQVARDHRYKLKHNAAPLCLDPDPFSDDGILYQSGPFELYDLEDDPGETRNLLDAPRRPRREARAFDRLCDVIASKIGRSLIDCRQRHR